MKSDLQATARCAAGPLRCRAHGFSLLELLVAMAILAMSLALLYQIDAGVVRGVSDLQMQQRATVLAQSILDSRDAVPASGWQEQGSVVGLDWSVQSTPLPRPVGVDLAAPLLHEVRIAIRWPGRGDDHTLTLTTLLPQALPELGEKRP